jgi:predicted acylesterase/phospholipase RssA
MFLDHLVAFARFRVRFAGVLPTLRVPTDAEFIVASSIEQVFGDRISEAADAFDDSEQDPPDFDSEFEGMLNTTFAQHRADLYPANAPSGPPPLAISGANLSSQESHLFSAVTTPWLCVADALRIATSLPPIFKPVVIDAKDIPSTWPRVMDTFASQHFMVGYWMDGGVYWNSPFDTFRAWETSDQMTLGIGIGIGARVPIDDLTDYIHAMVNVVYERNISATRADIDRFLVLDNHGISVTGPRMSSEELTFYRNDGWWQTFAYFGLVDAQPL